MDRLANWLGGGDPPPAPEPIPGVPPAPPSAPIAADDPRVPDASRPRVAQLLALAADVEARSRENSALVAARTEVTQIRDTHLPQLIESYASIPASHRAEIFRQTGKSASYSLNEALDRMIARMETLSRSLAQDHIDDFADNLRFIEHRYGGKDEPKI